jgi:hypothetical protein
MVISRAVSREPHPQPHGVVLRAVDCRGGWFAVHSQPTLAGFRPDHTGPCVSAPPPNRAHAASWCSAVFFTSLPLGDGPV